VFWFHPGARALCSHLSLARETVVDDITIRRTRNRRAYAEALLAFADPQQHIIGATPLIGRRSLRQRISLIAEEVPMSSRRATSHLTVSVAVVGVALTAVVLQLPLSSELYAQAAVYQPGNGVTLPFVLHEVKPVYTHEAMEQKIQGSVQLRIVVLANGEVGDVTVSKSLDAEYGLDQQAIVAAKQWTFRPGTKDGKPVPVEVTLEMTFTLR
jgi:TonB family protein